MDRMKLEPKHVRKWWAHVESGDGSYYGRWVPTGCIDKTDAIDYMSTYPGQRHVREWLQM